MEMSLLARELLALDNREHQIIYTSKDGTRISVENTGKISEKDFAVGLLIQGRSKFNPTHVRLLIDFYIKKESNPKGFRKLYTALERVFQGEDPVRLVPEIENINFPMQLDSAETNLYYAQLLMIEQDVNYGPNSTKPSKCDPPRDYLMRFFRWLASGDNTIDRVISAAVRNYPAPLRYANKQK